MSWLAAHEFVLIGLVFMLIFGPAVGNYACSVVYRLPRAKTPFERHPFCGHCNADLKPIDLIPILSWCRTRGKCRYCGGSVPAVYTVIEAVCGAIFIGYFLHFGMSEQFLLYAAYAVFVVILAAIHWQQSWIAASIYSYALTCIALVRAIHEHTVYGTIQSGFVMLVIMLLMWRAGSFLSRRPPQTPFEKPWIWWFTLIGALLPFVYWKFILPIYVMKLLVPKQARVIIYAAGALVLPLVL